MSMTFLDEMLDKAANVEAFQAWTKAYNRKFVKLTGMHPLDFPDHDTWSLFDEGVSPEEAAEDYADEMMYSVGGF
jgi:hypothetical protein